MRILIVEPNGHCFGHFSYYARRLAEHLLADKTVEVTVIGYGGWLDVWPEHPRLTMLQAEPSARVEDLPRYVDGHLWADWSAACLALAAREASHHDLVQFVDTHYPATAHAILASEPLRRRAVMLWHSVPMDLQIPRGRFPLGVRTRWRLRRQIRAERVIADALPAIAHAEPVAEALRVWNPELQLAVIPPGSDPPRELPSRAEARARLGLAGDDPAVLVFGHLGEPKGIGTLLAAVQGWTGPLQLYLAGAPAHGYDAPGAVAAAGWAERAVVKAEYIADDEVGLWFRAANVLLLAYPRTFVQNSGVLTRAADFRLPVLCCDVGQMGHLTAEYGLGERFEPEDPASLRAALERFLARGATSLAELEANLGRLAAETSWANIAARHLAFYREVVERRR